MAGSALVNNRFLTSASPASGGPDAGPWDRVGTIVQLDFSTDTVAIGAGAMVGSEKVRIVGSLRVEGQALADSFRAEDTTGGTAAFMEFDDGFTAAVSIAGEGRIRYNDTTMAFEVSENGGAYTPIFSPSGGGWTDDGANIRLTTSTDDVIIGALVPIGGERLRVVGAVRFEGTTNTEAVRIENGTGAFLEMDDGSSAAVSPASEGRFRYNTSTQQFEVSENGGAYVGITTQSGPWERVGTVVSLDTITDAVVIGAAAVSGTEKLRVIDDVLFESSLLISTGTAPAGSGTIALGNLATINFAGSAPSTFGAFFFDAGESFFIGHTILAANMPRIFISASIEVVLRHLTTAKLTVNGTTIESTDPLALVEEAGDPTAIASQGLLYTKAVSGESELFFRSSDGDITQLTPDTNAGPWNLAGTVVSLDTDSNSVVIGASAVSGTETFRQTAGSVLFDGSTGAVPVAGAGTRLMWSPAKAAFRAGVVTGTAWDDASVGSGSVAFGNDTIASGIRSTALGDATEAPAAHSMASGFEAQAARIGQHAQSNGAFVSRGDSQSSTLALRRQTPDATPIDATINGAAPAGAALATSNRFILEDDTSYMVRAMVTARNTAASESKGWEVMVVVKRDAGVATVALVGTQMKTTIGFTPAAASWDVNFSADTTNGALRVEVTGQAAKTINWTVGLAFAEVMG